MNGFPILGVGFFWNLIAFLFIVCCILLILIILVQKGKGGGLSSAFGGGMASGILGSKTGDFLTWVTIVFVAIMLTLSVLLVKYWKPGPTDVGGASGTTSTQQTPPPTAPTPKPAVPPEEAPPETSSAGQTTNDNNSAALTPGISITEESTLNVENTEPTGESTNESSDINQPAD